MKSFIIMALLAFSIIKTQAIPSSGNGYKNTKEAIEVEATVECDFIGLLLTFSYVGETSSLTPKAPTSNDAGQEGLFDVNLGFNGRHVGTFNKGLASYTSRGTFQDLCLNFKNMSGSFIFPSNGNKKCDKKNADVFISLESRSRGEGFFAIDEIGTLVRRGQAAACKVTLKR